jgi:hypothetical protein
VKVALVAQNYEKSFFEYVDDIMSRALPVLEVLRQVCIFSFVKGGLKQKQLDTFRKEFIQVYSIFIKVYGYQHIITFQKLLQLNLIKKHESSKNNYGAIVKQLNLINDYESFQPQSVSSVYAGYAPISVRLIQLASQSLEPSDEIQPLSWVKHLETLKLFPGPIIEECNLSSSSIEKNDPATLLVFIGGVTFAEISAIRCLSETSGYNFFMIGRKFTVLTTSIINAGRMFSSVMES